MGLGFLSKLQQSRWSVNQIIYGNYMWSLISVSPKAQTKHCVAVGLVSSTLAKMLLCLLVVTCDFFSLSCLLSEFMALSICTSAISRNEIWKVKFGKKDRRHFLFYFFS